ncbi:MAG TPA: hypothetical protein VKB24_03015, partial [Candidatus Acidoferrum sp.]|nr:hypothetical protein [Candidatus Acidoferrum sp.]
MPPTRKLFIAICLAATMASMATRAQQSGPNPAEESRPRARELGLSFGLYRPGPNNAITDVPGVLVG